MDWARADRRGCLLVVRRNSDTSVAVALATIATHDDDPLARTGGAGGPASAHAVREERSSQADRSYLGPIPGGSVISVSVAAMSANGVSEQGPTQDFRPYSDVRKACTQQYGDMIKVGELAKPVRYDVFVRSPPRSGLARVLTCMDATVRAEPGVACPSPVWTLGASYPRCGALHTNPGADAAHCVTGRRQAEISRTR
jgi:hypothetical protein